MPVTHSRDSIPIERFPKVNKTWAKKSLKRFLRNVQRTLLLRLLYWAWFILVKWNEDLDRSNCQTNFPIVWLLVRSYWRAPWPLACPFVVRWNAVARLSHRRLFERKGTAEDCRNEFQKNRKTKNLASNELTSGGPKLKLTFAEFFAF